MYNTKEEKKQKILDAAYRLFLQNGYNSTKIIDIAEAAGIGKGTVYEYFDSKATLLVNIISSGVDDYLDECRSVVESGSTQTKKLFDFIMLEANYIRENGTRMFKMSQAMLDTSDGLPREFINEMQELWNKKYFFVKDILSKGIEIGEFRKLNTEMTAIAIMGASSGYLNMKYGMSQLTDIKLPFKSECFKHDELIDLMLKGIEA